MDREKNLQELAVHMYTLVEFITRGRRPVMKKIDIVPTLWVDYNNQTKKFFTRFLSPPYTSENVNNLHEMIKNCDYPLQEWPIYSVILKGRAKTYEEALHKLARLEKEEHVFTLESDNTTLAEKEAETIVKQSKFKTQVEELKQKFIVRKLGSKSFAQNLEEPETSEEELFHIKDTKKKRYYKKKNIVSAANQPESENIRKKANLFDNSLKENKLERASTSKSQKSMTKEIIEGLKMPPNSPNIHTCMNDQQVSVQISDDTEDQYQFNYSNIRKCNEQNYESEMVLLNAEQNKNNLSSKKSLSKLNNIYQSNLVLETLAADIAGIKCDLKFIKSQLKKLCNEMQIKEAPVCNSNIFLENYNISLPINNFAKFVTFDERLKSDEKLRVDVNSMLRICLDKNQVVSKSLVNMLKKFITAEIAMKFTSSKKVHNKFIMCNTAFFNCMKDVILLNASIMSKCVSEKDIISALGKVLSNSRDWEGVRRLKTIVELSTPCQDLNNLRSENNENNITTAQTSFFVNESDQLEFQITKENNNDDLDDSLSEEL